MNISKILRSPFIFKNKFTVTSLDFSLGLRVGSAPPFQVHPFPTVASDFHLDLL